jgi:dTDP-4-dehydrorhamnose reductase
MLIFIHNILISICLQLKEKIHKPEECNLKILITGASGLLGSDIVHFSEQKSAQFPKIIKVCSKPSVGFLQADLTTETGIRKISESDWDILIHAAAWRSPDQCEKDNLGAHRLNAWATEQLASEAANRGAKIFYISTDYVFPGTNPPYKEDDIPSPVNYYGETKLQGEKAVLNLCGNSCILRIPLLYGIRAGLAKSDLLAGTLRALESEKPWPMEDSIVRYPTFTGDVAEAVFFLIEKNASGIFHFSGQDKTSRYRITETFAKVFVKSMKNIVRLEEAPKTEAARPHDSHLSINKILSMGFPLPMTFEERIILLKPEIEKALTHGATSCRPLRGLKDKFK